MNNQSKLPCWHKIAGWNKAEIDEVGLVSDYQSGMSGTALAKKYGVSWPTIYSRLRKLGVQIRTNSEAHRGMKPGNYKGGHFDAAGYHCQWINGKQVRTHRLIAGAKPGEVVHHKNHNRGDNADSNLEKLASQSDHMKQHMTTEEARRRGALGLIAQGKRSKAN